MLYCLYRKRVFNRKHFPGRRRKKAIERLIPAGEFTVVGASGDISDLQAITTIIDDMT